MGQILERAQINTEQRKSLPGPRARVAFSSPHDRTTPAGWIIRFVNSSRDFSGLPKVAGRVGAFALSTRSCCDNQTRLAQGGHAYEANTPNRPWHSVPNWPDQVAGDEMVAAIDRVDVPVL